MPHLVGRRRGTGFELHPRELKIGSQTLRFKNGGAIPLRETVGIDALIGRDVLSSAYLVYNGIKGTVSVSSPNRRRRK